MAKQYWNGFLKAVWYGPNHPVTHNMRARSTPCPIAYTAYTTLPQITWDQRLKQMVRTDGEGIASLLPPIVHIGKSLPTCNLLFRNLPGVGHPVLLEFERCIIGSSTFHTVPDVKVSKSRRMWCVAQVAFMAQMRNECSTYVMNLKGM
jgi:hypothetical protein